MNEQIIQIFLDHPNQYVSGEKLSEALNCSRTAIWKHIQGLKKKGYVFESTPRLGYRMLQIPPEPLNVKQLISMLDTACLGIKIKYVQEVGSTQTLAAELVKKGAEEGTVVIAEQQTEGRGRLGRKWFSPAGTGIWMSLILKPQIPLQFIHQLTLLISVAVCRVLKRMLNIDVGIKWPNDLYVGGKKVCGILLESSAEDERLKHVIAGIGISVNLKQEDIPEELKDKMTSLYVETGEQINREELFVLLFKELEELYHIYLSEGFAPIRILWEALAICLDCPIQVHTHQGTIQGRAYGMDEMGALMITDEEGNEHKIYSGDVSLNLV
ncbi:biotin--[acetyl-CoA-carboxylase] ligase [Chengkuizengella axinellae]|uniref:Bifunctional ligase/repressor BirA n=1 Tax=Chengkuizengella axinellae TaxID=3064388 RepID=A0ABT9IWU1_9BACL|nr:biotin--[acetyl-CoA-carboxylase] ligase [Chengkuizengella sp. 2205SS18-9]MDP5273835.1 biotin--[acetyl-CoA-carboxylase] ligase [Chengkuizengella sp. 2205SS18-9]